MNDGLSRPSVLGETLWILKCLAQILHWQVFPRRIDCKEDEYMVGADYLQVAIHMQCVSMFQNSMVGSCTMPFT